MKGYFGLIFILGSITLISCNQEDNSIVEQGDVLSSDVQDTCNCEELVIDSLGNYSDSESKPYTGVCVSYYPNTDIKYIEKNLLEGSLHGKVTYYDKNGEVLIEEIYESGKAKRSGTADFIECNCNELEIMKSSDPRLPSRFQLDDIPFTGVCRTYYTDSVTVTMEAIYENGYLNGYTTYFDRNGEKLYSEKYYQGILEKVIN